MTGSKSGSTAYTMKFSFGPPDQNEHIVFGAQRPGYPGHTVPAQAVDEWTAFMKGQSISRICCLLPRNQLMYYEHLPEDYYSAFGHSAVCFASVEDYHLCDRATLIGKILPFLKGCDAEKQKVVVHCSGGSGRTGHVLAAWLVFGRGWAYADAIAAVQKSGRNPFEAIQFGNARPEDLEKLLS